MNRKPDELGGEHGENVGLQERHEQFEEVRLKKKKLAIKDEMESIVRRADH